MFGMECVANDVETWDCEAVGLTIVDVCLLKANDVNVMDLSKWLYDVTFCCWQPLDLELHDAQGHTYGLKAQVGIIGGVLPGFVTGIHKDSVRRWNLWFPSAGVFAEVLVGRATGMQLTFPPVNTAWSNTFVQSCVLNKLATFGAFLRYSDFRVETFYFASPCSCVRSCLIYSTKTRPMRVITSQTPQIPWLLQLPARARNPRYSQVTVSFL